jgi:KaiC/GvpD/RAD55 family RecA-like ATPase
MFNSMMSGSSSPDSLAKFGIGKFDEALGGGIPRGSVILLEDEIGTEATPFAVQFLHNGLVSGDYSYILTTENILSYYDNLLSSFGSNPQMHLRTGRLRYIDGFSAPYGFTHDLDVTEGIEPIRDVSQPRVVNEAIRRSLLHIRDQSVGIRGMIDTLSSIIHIGDSRAVYSLLLHHLATTKNSNGVTMMILHADAHNKTLVKSIEHMCDGVIKVTLPEQEEGENIQEVTVVKMKGRPESSNIKLKFTYSSGKIIPIHD